MNIITALRRHSIDVLVLAALSLGGLYVAARAGLAPRDHSAGVAVIFSPWTTPDAALGRAVEAGSRFVRFGGLPFITVVIPDDAGYGSRILGSGAWLVIDPKALASCLPFLATGSERK